MSESFISEAAAASSSSAMAVLLPITMLVLLAAVVAPHSKASQGAYYASSSMEGMYVVAGDARLKANLVATGKMAMHGLELYQFSYKGYPQHRYESVLAQDVACVMPSAVVTGKSGYLAVDYKKPGLDIRILR